MKQSQIITLKNFKQKNSILEPSRKLSKIYQKQAALDSQNIIKQIAICLTIFIITETVRLAVYESLLDGEVDWDEILSIIGFAFLLALIPAGKILYKKKSVKCERAYQFLKLLFIFGDCTLISIRATSFGPFFKVNPNDDRYNFTLVGLGTSVVPYIIISDLVFTNWLEKCIIPIWFMFNIGYLILKFQPYYLGALLLKIFTYCVYIFIGFWVREKLHWQVFLQRAQLNEWNELQKEILLSVPENIAVFNFDGKLLYQNQYFEKLRDMTNTKEGEGDILSSIVQIKRRTNFVTLKNQVSPYTYHK